MDRISKLIDEIRKYGINNNVPIMSKDTIDTINKIIDENNIKSILEIGSAIGYSTLCFASNKNIEKITSIERDDERYNIAYNNVLSSGLSNIELIHYDALNTNIEGMYDLIIIDAAKSQNKRFLDKYKYNLNEKGVIIIDNLDFHGYVFNSSSIKSRNLRQMVRKIEKFITYLKTQDEFSVEFIKVGDTIGVCKRKNL
ncbi:hAD-superfamily hydrolase subfamily IA variant 1 [Clostridium sp. CAG:1000]|nr:hAD-superfamily hydrolase subfamily IA variant 1 [Clostridium sp. CAG:1000]